jgi:hypothetical protein
MKSLILFALLLFPFAGFAVTPVTVGSGKVKTAPGIGGYAQIGYAFAKGDRISITANADKKLDRMIVLLFPDVEIGRDKLTKDPSYTFTMPENGIVVFRFISDRPGTNDINYSVTRTPASNAVQNYDTRVVWLKPAAGTHGDLTPVRADEVTDMTRVAKIIN